MLKLVCARPQRIMIAGLLLLTVLYILRLGPLPLPTYPAFGDDNSVYLVTALSLAEGKGYRYISQPLKPVQNYYPIGYPAVMSVILRFVSLDGFGIAMARLISVASCLIFVMVTQKFMRRYTSYSVAAGIALLIGLSPQIFELSGEIMSDALFSWLALMAIMLAGGSLTKREDKALTFELAAILAGICAGSAFLVRTIGIIIILAIGLTYLLRRKWRKLLCYTVPCGLIAIPWLTWGALQGGGSLHGYFATFKSDFSLWWPLNNIRFIITAFLPRTIFAPFETNIGRAILNSAGLSWLVWLSGILACVLILIGLVSMLKKLDIVAICFICYMGVILLWEWEPSRFLVLILPFFAILFLEGVRALAGQITDLTKPKKVLLKVFFACLVFSALGALSVDMMRLRNIYAYRHWGGRGAAAQWDEISLAFTWMRRNLPKDAVVISSFSFGTYLFTGLNTLDQSSATQMYELISNTYKTRPLYVFATERKHPMTAKEYGLSPVRQFIAYHPDLLKLVWANNDRKLEVYKVLR